MFSLFSAELVRGNLIIQFLQCSGLYVMVTVTGFFISFAQYNVILFLKYFVFFPHFVWLFALCISSVCIPTVLHLPIIA